MNKMVRFHAALIMMCVVAFTVSLGSCDKNEVDNHEDENSLSLKVDTNGVNFTITPLINWKANLDDVEKFMARHYPDLDICNDGKLEYDDVCDLWTLEYDNHNNMSVYFLFSDGEGKGLGMVEFDFDSSCDVDKIRDELSGLGFIFKGLLYWDIYPEDMNYMYLSNDEKLEIQLIVNNCGDEDYWFISFQPFDKDDLNHLIDQTPLNINIDAEEGTYSLTPFIKWDASSTDVMNYMTEKYPDWEAAYGGELIKDTIHGDDISLWFSKFSKDSMNVFFYFDDAEGVEFCNIQYVYYSSTDLTTVKNELTRNGIVFLCSEEGKTYETQLSHDLYAPLSKDYLVEVAAWDLYGGCWTLDLSPYDEEYVKQYMRD